MPDNQERFRLAQNIHADAVEAFADISARPLFGVNSDKSLEWHKKLLIDHQINELTLSRFEEDSAMSELKIRLLGASATRDVMGVLVETREIDDEGETTKLYNVRSNEQNGESEFVYMAHSDKDSSHVFPYQSMPGGAVEDLTRILTNREV